MKLNTRLQICPDAQHLPPIVLIHGLFGSLDNLGILARDLHQHRTVLQIDLRNHGRSPWDAEMSYQAMALDVIETLNEHGINRAIILGHSMGGKVAMALTAQFAERIEKLIVLDIAPVAYNVRRHDEIFAALHAVNAAKATTRQQATEVMSTFLEDAGVINFLLKSFNQGEWRFNLPVLEAQYQHILGWQNSAAWPHPILFIAGGNSPYIAPEYRENIVSQFPAAQAHVIAGAGHWVHAEKPEAVLRAIHRFLSIPAQD